MSKHTPGPWTFDPSTPEQRFLAQVWDSEGNALATLENIGQNEDADAALIAAAPDLLDALQGMLDEFFHAALPPGESPMVDKARAAIAKATGRL